MQAAQLARRSIKLASGRQKARSQIEICVSRARARPPPLYYNIDLWTGPICATLRAGRAASGERGGRASSRAQNKHVHGVRIDNSRGRLIAEAARGPGPSGARTPTLGQLQQNCARSKPSRARQLPTERRASRSSAKPDCPRLASSLISALAHSAISRPADQNLQFKFATRADDE